MIYFTADWHLGKRQYGLEKRENDFYKSAYNFIEKIIPASKIVNAGDLFDNNHPGSRALHEVKKLNDLLVSKQSIMYYIEGNHDKTYPHYIDLFNTESCYGIKLLQDGGIYQIDKNTNIVGFSEQPKNDLLHKIASLDLAKLNGYTNILMLHISCRDFCDGFFNDSAISISDIPNINYFKYIVIGDTHVHNKVIFNNRNIVMSPGSIEMVSSSEDPIKSVFALNIKTGSITDLPIETRQCLKISINTEQDIDKFVMDFTNAIPKQNIIIYLTISKTVLGVGRILALEKEFPDVIIKIKYKTDCSAVHENSMEIETDEKVNIKTFANKFMSHCNFKDNDIVNKLLDFNSANDYSLILDEYVKKGLKNE